MAQFHKEFFPIGMDFDTILEFVGQPAMGSFPGAYISARNGHLYPGKFGGGNMYRKMGGTEEIIWDNARTGTEEGMGAFWDEKLNTLIGFVHNSDGQDSIIWHKPDTNFTGTIRIPGGVNGKVTGAVLINGELLAWTDRADYPKMIDLPRADDTQKIFKLRVFLPQSDALVDFREFRVQTVLAGIPQGVPIGPPTFSNATTRQVRDFRPMVGHFADQWNNITALSSPFTATATGEWIELEATTAGEWSATVTTTDYINGIPQAPVQCVVEKLNAYNGAWHFAQMRLSREKPITPPAIEMGTDTTRESNLLRTKMFQFCYGFRLKNKERTLTSPFSGIAVPSSGSCTSGGASAPNFIDVGFSADKWLNDAAIRGEIEVIDIYARDGNLGAWMLVDSLDKWEWMYRRSYRFYNDNVSSPADPAFIEQSMTYVPPLANALEVFRDIDDNQRIVMGGIKEGDDNPAIDITFGVELSQAQAQPQLVDLAGRITIMGVFDPNPAIFGTQHYNFNQPIWFHDSTGGVVYGGFGPSVIGNTFLPLVEFLTNDPQTWGQKLPLGGFPVYVAGTDKYDISVQTNFPATVSGGTVNATLWPPPQGDSSIGRIVYDGSVRGYSLTPTNRTHRDAIRSMIQDDHIYSTFTIKGLERGKTYIIRIASNLVDILDDGSRYDLNNANPTTSWHTTSTRTAQVGSNDALIDPSGGFYPTGTVITSGPNECVVTIPLTGPAVIDIGNCIIMDTTNPNPIDGSFVIDGYNFDNLGVDYSTAQDVRTLGVSAEKQLVRFLNHGVGQYDPFANPSFNILYLAPFLWPLLAPTIIYNTFIQQLFGLGTGFPGDYRTYTDHNGYWWFFNKNQVGHSPQAQWCGVTGNPSNPSGVVTTTNSPNGTQFYQILNDFNDSKWEGGLEGALAPVSGNLFPGPGWKQYIFANLLATLTHRTHVKALIQDVGTGNGIAGMTALMQNGRSATSDQDGIVDLVVFGDVIENLNRRYLDELFLYNNTPCMVTFIGGNSRVVNIDQFTPGGDYSESPDTNWFDVHFIVPITAMVIPARLSCFSRGGTYSIAGAFGRWDGSGTPPKEFATLRIPNLGEDLTLFDPLQWPPALFPGGLWSSGVASIRWTIAGVVPIPWIGRWEYLQLYVTKDLARDFQLQWVAGEVTYSSVWSEADTLPTPTSFSSGNATEIYIVLLDSLVRYQELNTSSTLGYLWQSGDMLRIISDANGGQVFTVMEYEISGQRNASGQVGKWIVLKADSSMPQIVAGMRMEIFRPALAGDDPQEKEFYAVPGGLILVDDPYGPNPTWSALTGVLDKGDTWLIPTKVPFGTGTPVQWSSRLMTRESKSYSDLFESNSWDRGKVLFPDPDAKVQLRGLLMRYSDIYLPGTNVNQLNFFGGFNVKATENWMGEIQAIVEVQESFVVPCTNGTFAIYKGIQQLRETAESLTQIAGGVLANIRPMAHHYGTVDPQSVRRTATTVMAFDRRKGVLWQWGSNQLNPVSKQRKANTYFMRKAAALPVDKLCISGWDMVNGEVLFSFPTVTYTGLGEDGLPLSVIDPPETMQYHDEANHFVFLMDWSPDFWGHTSLALYSFKRGRLWKHEARFDPASLNVIADVQLDLQTTIPLNGDPMVVADIRTVWLARGPGWSIPEITNNMGQRSYVPEDLMITREGGIYKAQLLPDTTSGHEGAVLKATAYKFKFLHPGPTPCGLYMIRFGETPSADSGMNAAGQ